MAISLEELKRQREQIQKHLDWLDAKIRELEPLEPSEEQPKAAAKASTSATVVPANTAEPNVEHETREEPSQETPPGDHFAPEIEPAYKAKTQDELQRAKVGCILFFVLAIVLFIFLLFGLPYYL